MSAVEWNLQMGAIMCPKPNALGVIRVWGERVLTLANAQECQSWAKFWMFVPGDWQPGDTLKKMAIEGNLGGHLVPLGPRTPKEVDCLLAKGEEDNNKTWDLLPTFYCKVGRGSNLTPGQWHRVIKREKTGTNTFVVLVPEEPPQGALVLRSIDTRFG